MNRDILVHKALAKRELQLREARSSFWSFCKLLSPDFYKDSRPHLKTICDTLQGLYEKRLIMTNGLPYKKLCMSIPPSHLH